MNNLKSSKNIKSEEINNNLTKVEEMKKIANRINMTLNKDKTKGGGDKKI